MPRRQHPPHIQLPDIDRLELLAFIPDTTRQRLDRRIRVGSQEERKRVPPLARHVAHAVDGGGEKPVRVAFEVLADVADEGAGDGRGRDPEPVGVEDFERRDVVLEDQSQPCTENEFNIFLFLEIQNKTIDMAT